LLLMPVSVDMNTEVEVIEQLLIPHVEVDVRDWHIYMLTCNESARSLGFSDHSAFIASMERCEEFVPSPGNTSRISRN